MVRLLFWAALIAAAIWFWRKYQRTMSGSTPPADPDATPMVRCSHCGVHLPRARALSQQQQWYCSQTHLEQGPASRER